MSSYAIRVTMKPMTIDPQNKFNLFVHILENQVEFCDLVQGQRGILVDVRYDRMASLTRHLSIRGMDPPGHVDRPTMAMGVVPADRVVFTDPGCQVAVDIWVAGKLHLAGFILYAGGGGSGGNDGSGNDSMQTMGGAEEDGDIDKPSDK